jgi:hypothetical protein
MIDMQTRFDYFRLSGASCAVAISIVICRLRRHFHIDVGDPHTYLSPLGHKCGFLLVASLIWLTVEMVRLGTSAAAFGPMRADRS